MGKRGPAARPRLQVVREGNPGKKSKAELAAQVVLPPEAPAEPDWSRWFPTGGNDDRLCKAAAKRTWDNVVKMLDAQGFLAQVDLEALTDLCVCEARLLQLERDISRNGVSTEGERGAQKNPSVTAANQYRTHLRHLRVQFYMSPAARARATSGGGSDVEPDDPWG